MFPKHCLRNEKGLFFFACDLSNPAIATQPNKTGDNYRPKLFLDNLAGPAPTHAWTLRITVNSCYSRANNSSQQLLSGTCRLEERVP